MQPTPEFDQEFAAAIEAWRQEHGLRDDDPVLLCVQLFRLHQRHWDEIRRRDLPSFQQFQGDIAKLTETSSLFRREASALVEVLRNNPASAPHGVSAAIAIFSITLALLAGFLLGAVLL